MKQIYRWSIAFILILSIQPSYGQKMAYTVSDSVVSSGIKLVKGTSKDNAQFVQLRSKNKEITYYPDQLKEYGFNDGSVYESKSISISGKTKQVFLERLEKGKLTLYYYTEKGIKTYFLGRDSSVFIELKKEDDYQRILSEYTDDFDWKAGQIQLVRYNRKSLSKLISFYNNDIHQPLPYPRFGIIAGYKNAALIIPSSISLQQLNKISFSPSSSVSIGIFGDLPIEMSNFSLNVGMNFSRSGFSANYIDSVSDIDVVVNITSVNLPVLLRYTFPTLVWKPFVNAGGIYTYHLKNESQVYESTLGPNVITFNEVQREPLISESMLGYSLGLGLQRNLGFKKMISWEVRLNQLYGSGRTLNTSHFEMLTSLSF